MRRSSVLLSIVCLLLVFASLAHAAASRVAWLPNTTELSAQERAGLSAYDFPGGSILVGATDTTLPAGAQTLSVPGREFYLVSSDALGGALDAYVVKAAGDRAVVAIPPTEIQLVEPALRKVRLDASPPRIVPRRAAHVAKREVDPQVKSNIVAAVDQVAYSQYIRELCGDATAQVGGNPVVLDSRYTFRATNPIAADYVQEQLESFGYDVLQQAFTVNQGPGATATNVIATKPGTTSADEIVLVGGHYDSLCTGCDPMTDPAPGAEDNASGVAAVLHLAEIYADYDTERTVVFIAFGAEEQGLLGAKHYADQLSPTEIADHVAALTMDMISYRNLQFSVDVEGFDGTENLGNAADSRTLMDLFIANVQSTVPTMATRSVIPGWGSDHQPLDFAGIPSVLIIESEYPFYPDYHRSTDTYDKIDPALGTDVTRVLAATLADLTMPTPKDDVPVVAGDFRARQVGSAIRLEWTLPASAGVNAVSVLRWTEGRTERLTDRPLTASTQMSYTDAGAGLRAGQDVQYGLEFWLDDGSTEIAASQIGFRYTASELWIGRMEPNPVRGETTLRFSLPTSQRVSVRVYDVAGRLVRELLDQVLPSGPSQLGFDGRDARGERVGAGIYLLRVRTETGVATRRVTVLD